MVIASPTLGARHWPQLAKSRLYDASFTHRFRRASAPPADTPGRKGTPPKDMPPKDTP